MRMRVRGSAPDQFELNLTPLLDVILQLITFFMMLVHFGTTIEGATRSVRLPVAPAALPANDLSLDRLVVAVDRLGRLLANDEARAGDSAASWWADQARIRRAGRRGAAGPGAELSTTVVIRADRDAAYGAVRRTLAQAQASGFAHFTLVVLREERP